MLKNKKCPEKEKKTKRDDLSLIDKNKRCTLFSVYFLEQIIQQNNV